ncbi:LPXTG cell wall anchor domain-containing protein [Micromonospora echinofusca]|uniref:LPXTG cell wall anchor domain-containing protein n=1 Tax=Micromonospora echinofusca TaxID=47858 RepID=UPI000C70E894
MLKHSTRRWLAGLGVAGALVAASASPAAAAAPDGIKLYFPDTTVALDTPGKVRTLQLYTEVPTMLHNVSVRYDYRSLAGKVTVDPTFDAGDCETPEAGVLVCREHLPVQVDEYYGAWLNDLDIVATDKAKLDDAGDLKISFRVGDKERATYTAKIRVGEGVDLAGGPEQQFKAAVGGSVKADLTVANIGQTTARGVVALFDNDYPIRAKDKFSNCLYAEDFVIACQFDEEIPAGEGRTTTLNYRIAEDAYAPSNAYGNTRFMTPSDFEELFAVREASGAKAARRGAGAKLTLAKAAAKTARAAQTDTDPDNDFSPLLIEITGKNGADLEAIGDKLDGAAGKVVTATVGFRNNGPATLENFRTDSDVTYVNVTVPEGTTAVEVPGDCAPREGDRTNYSEAGTPGAREYRCYPGPFAPAGEALTVEFRLRIDKVIDNATGAVKVNAPCECEGGFYDDLKPANDAAKILVNASGGEGGGNGDGDGGTLPITGESTGLIAGIGGLLLVAGVGGYVIAKRRRTRFVA